MAQVAALGRIPHRDAADAPVTHALQSCGILPLRDRRVDRISGGEARRAMLARAFATEPDLFLLDEPTADLDPAAAQAIMRLLRDTAEAGRAVVVVQHAIDLAIRFAHRIIVLRSAASPRTCPRETHCPRRLPRSACLSASIPNHACCRAMTATLRALSRPW